MIELPSGTDFADAVAAHFSLPSEQLLGNAVVNTGHDDMLSVTVTIALKPADLAGIAGRMKAAEKPNP